MSYICSSRTCFSSDCSKTGCSNYECHNNKILHNGRVVNDITVSRLSDDPEWLTTETWITYPHNCLHTIIINLLNRKLLEFEKRELDLETLYNLEVRKNLHSREKIKLLEKIIRKKDRDYIEIKTPETSDDSDYSDYSDYSDE